MLPEIRLKSRVGICATVVAILAIGSIGLLLWLLTSPGIKKVEDHHFDVSFVSNSTMPSILRSPSSTVAPSTTISPPTDQSTTISTQTGTSATMSTPTDTSVPISPTFSPSVTISTQTGTTSPSTELPKDREWRHLRCFTDPAWFGYIHTVDGKFVGTVPRKCFCDCILDFQGKGASLHKVEDDCGQMCLESLPPHLSFKRILN